MALSEKEQKIKATELKQVEYKVVAASDHYFATSCRITWIPNYETNGEEIIFEALADATINNTKSFARFFLIRKFCA